MRKLKSTLQLSSLIGCALSPTISFAQKATAKNPNIIYILADDMGWGELGCYGNTKIKTPNLDRMAANGMRFTQNYSGSAVSGPSRSCLFTGQHAGYAWTRDNSPIDDPLPTGAKTIGSELKKLGYATGAFGKWGGGTIGTTGAPWNQGFDTFFGYLTHDPAHNYYPDNLYSNSTIVPLNNSGISAHPSTIVSPANDSTKYLQFIGKEWSNTRIKEEAIKFIQANKNQKFLAYMPFTVPHMALQAPLDSLEKYYGKAAMLKEGKTAFPETPYAGGSNYTPAFKPRAMYATMITLLDVYVGQIEAELKAQHLDTCTVIMFSSDNGTTNSTGGIFDADKTYFNLTGGLRGAKYTWYEGGIRVPLIAYWPGHIPAGVSSSLITHNEDILPTIVEMAGGTPPSSSTGISLVPTLLPNGTTQQKHTHIYWENATGNDALQAIRVGKWKLHRQKIRTGEVYELYNLDTDLKEATNLATTLPDTVSMLKKYLADRVDAHLANWNFLLPGQVIVPVEGIAADNNSLSFNGISDWVELTGYKGIGGGNPRTVEAWVKTSATSPGEIIAWGANATAKKWAIRLDNAEPYIGKLRVEGGGSWIIGTKVINDGQWHHIAVSFPGGSLSTTKLYIDGQLDAISNSTDAVINTDATTGMAVQISKGYSTRYWNGELDEIRIWNTARTAQEIAANYQCPISNPATTAGLVNYYNFNRDKATVLPDMKGTAKGYLMSNMPSTSWTVSQAATCGTSGLRNNTLADIELTIAPNPCQGKFTLNCNSQSLQSADIAIYDSFGQSLYSKRNAIISDLEIALDQKCQGIVFVQITGNELSLTRKLIVNK